jgi:hypothetical protein
LGYILIMGVHIIKLIVGCETLEDYARILAAQVMDYEGQAAVPCWTRFMPKRADEVLRSGGSLYRVMKSRVQCRQRILGFEMVEVEGADGAVGKKCLILQDPEIITTVAMAHRPFQGWRYFDPAKAPEDKGVYILGQDEDEPPEDMGDELREAGLL